MRKREYKGRTERPKKEPKPGARQRTDRYKAAPPEPWPLPKSRFEFDLPARSYSMAPSRRTA